MSILASCKWNSLTNLSRDYNSTSMALKKEKEITATNNLFKKS